MQLGIRMDQIITHSSDFGILGSDGDDWEWEWVGVDGSGSYLIRIHSVCKFSSFHSVPKVLMTRLQREEYMYILYNGKNGAYCCTNSLMPEKGYCQTGEDSSSL